MKKQLELVKERFSVDDVVPNDVPLFPNAEGKTCNKDAIVKTIEAIVTKLDLPIKDEDGNNLYGGHSIRIMAARHLAAIGIALPVIMLLARWESNIIMRYVAEAPLNAVTQEYKNLQSHKDLTE